MTPSIPYVLSHKTLTILKPNNLITIPYDEELFTYFTQLPHENDRQTAITQLTRAIETINIDTHNNQLTYNEQPTHPSILRWLITSNHYPTITINHELTPYTLRTNLLNKGSTHFLANLNAISRLLTRCKQINLPKTLGEELLYFVLTNDLFVCKNGCFLAYKYVKTTGYDHHSNTIHNDIGSIVSMPREDVDDNPKRDCAPGLHVGSRQYIILSVFETPPPPDKPILPDHLKIIGVIVDPQDAVAIPCWDKMRVCRYQVWNDIPDLLTFDPNKDFCEP